MMMRFPRWTMASLWLAAAAGHAQDDGNHSAKPDPETSRELIRQWVQTERIISEEKTSWQVEQARMQELLGIYRKELALLNEELDQAGGSAELVDGNKQKLEESLAQYREAGQALRASMGRLLPRMRLVLAGLPGPLLEEIAADVNVLNAPAALEEPRDVLKAMISVLNAAERFNRTITLVEETRIQGDGKKLTVDVLYLGLARAFYASASGTTAGVGIPTGQGWSWTGKPELGDAVRKLIAVYQKSEQPQIVELPVQLHEDKTR